jgi:hypothetical protein
MCNRVLDRLRLALVIASMIFLALYFAGLIHP